MQGLLAILYRIIYSEENVTILRLVDVGAARVGGGVAGRYPSCF